MVFATDALGMGVDIHSNHNVVHITPPIQSRPIFKKQVGLEELGNQQLLFYITTIKISQRINQECNKQFELIAKVKASASGTFC